MSAPALSPSQQALLDRVVDQFGVDWISGGSDFRFAEADGIEMLVVDRGSVIFSMAGEDLHVAGPVPGGEVWVAVYAPDHKLKGVIARPDPGSAEVARWN